MCNFCEALKAENELMVGRVCYEFSVAKIKRTWTREKGKRNASETTEKGFFLNFCPECGRKIKLQERLMM